MKKLIAVIVLSLIAVSTSFAGDNQKLWKEINRKLKIDASQVSLSKEHKNYVVVKFRIVDGNIEILGSIGSVELRTMIVEKLEEMEIKSEANENEVYRYKFTVREEV